MSDGNKMTRRDWFRLTARRAETEAPDSANESSMGKQANALAPIEHPVNHDGMDLSKLPPMREATLTAMQVSQLFTDIGALASDVLLMQRKGRSERATASRATTADELLSAQEAILRGTITRLQLRYRWNAANWIDTLQSHSDSFQLIRIQHASEGDSPSD